MVQLTMVQQVADHFLAASADRVVQECVTVVVPVHEIAPGSVQLLQLGQEQDWAPGHPFQPQKCPPTHRPQV